jgi:hypothetical protein
MVERNRSEIENPGAPEPVTLIASVAGTPATDAVTVFTPIPGPSVHAGTAATPFVFVVAVFDTSEPPPAVTVNATMTPASGFPN